MELNVTQMKSLKEILNGSYYSSKNNITEELKDEIEKTLRVEQAKFELARNSVSRNMLSVFLSSAHCNDFKSTQRFLNDDADNSRGIYDSYSSKRLQFGNGIGYNSPICIKEMATYQPSTDRDYNSDEPYEMLTHNRKHTTINLDIKFEINSAKISYLEDCEDIDSLNEILNDLKSLSEKVATFQNNLKEKQS